MQRRCRPNGTSHYWPAVQCYCGAIIRLEVAWLYRLACVGEASCGPTVEYYRRRQTTDAIEQNNTVIKQEKRNLALGITDHTENSRNDMVCLLHHVCVCVLFVREWRRVDGRSSRSRGAAGRARLCRRDAAVEGRRSGGVLWRRLYPRRTRQGTSDCDTIWYDTIRYIYVRSKADKRPA